MEIWKILFLFAPTHPLPPSHFSLLSPLQWHPLLLTLRQAVDSASGSSFNSLLCNLYRNESDSIGWHSDDEASLGTKPTIASLSLGDTRVFSLRKKPPPVRVGVCVVCVVCVCVECEKFW